MPVCGFIPPYRLKLAHHRFVCKSKGACRTLESVSRSKLMLLTPQELFRLTDLNHKFRSIYRKPSIFFDGSWDPEFLIPGSSRKTDDIIQEYKRLIRSMPRANQYLLLYVLDLLSVFARKADKNLMTASSELFLLYPCSVLRFRHFLTVDELPNSDNRIQTWQ